MGMSFAFLDFRLAQSSSGVFVYLQSHTTWRHLTDYIFHLLFINFREAVLQDLFRICPTESYQQ